jgi:hypothetical protein
MEMIANREYLLTKQGLLYHCNCEHVNFLFSMSQITAGEYFCMD